VIAEALNISKAEVHGVVTFYHDYRSQPAGRHVLKICQAEACQSMGSDEALAANQAALGIGFHETTADGSVTLEPVYCLGLCACAPAAMLDGEVIGTARRRQADRGDCRGGADCERNYLHSRRFRRAGAWRREGREGHRRRARRAASRQPSSATARAASTGWSRWSRLQTGPAASPMAR
jgi:hypothetical protein